MISIRAALEAAKTDLIAEADHTGKSCWLWMPHPGCKNASVCLVAHIDTVWDYRRAGERRRIYHDPKAGVYWSPDGLGADDRAGVYACKLLREYTGCMVLLTDGEESGGIGAREAAETFQKYFRNIAFFLEIDRQGNGEAVYYNGESPEFKAFIAGFGFREHTGSFSDISVLSRSLHIPGVNVSAGYYGQHTHAEYLRERDLGETIQKVLKIIKKGDKDYGKQRDQWQIAKKVCPEFGGHYDTGDVFVSPHRPRKGPKMAGRWEF